MQLDAQGGSDVARGESAVGRVIDALAREGARFASRDPGEASPIVGAVPGHEIVIDMQLKGLRVLVLQPASRPPEQALHFTAREHEIARMVAAGYPNKTIASVLGISVWTVSTYLRRMFAKLGVSSRAAMVWALASASPTNEARGDDPA